MMFRDFPTEEKAEAFLLTLRADGLGPLEAFRTGTRVRWISGGY